MPLNRAIKLIKRAKTETEKETVYMQWLMFLPHMTKDTYISFEDFFESLQTPQLDIRDKDEIIKGILYGGN